MRWLLLENGNDKLFSSSRPICALAHQEPGPIRRGLSVRALALDPFRKIRASAYGSLLSQGRQAYALNPARSLDPCQHRKPLDALVAVGVQERIIVLEGNAAVGIAV